jgi:hypothetical protein
VVLGNLTGLLARIKPAIPATKFEGEKSSKNAAYVDAVAHTNVVLALADILRRSGEERNDPDRRHNVLSDHGRGGVSRLVVDAHNSQFWLIWWFIRMAFQLERREARNKNQIIVKRYCRTDSMETEEEKRL